MMQWQRLTPRSFADALAVLSERRWWTVRRGEAKVPAGSAAAAAATDRTPGARPSRLVRLRRPF